MHDLRPIAIALYAFRRTPAGFEFLQLRRTESAKSHPQTWQTIYGSIEPGESAPQAALRELKEETNLTPTQMFQVEYLESFYFRPTDSLTIMPVFAAEVAASAPITLNEEHDAHRWVPQPLIETHFMWRSQREALHFAGRTSTPLTRKKTPDNNLNDQLLDI